VPRLLRYAEGAFAFQTLEAGGAIRAGNWRRDGQEALLVGNRGAAVRWDEAGFHRLASPVDGNMRGVEFHPRERVALVVGNHGLLLHYEGTQLGRIATVEHRNLRRVAWHPRGDSALIVGNEGAAYRIADGELSPIGTEGNNLRGVAWHPSGDYALVTANSYRGGFVPTPVLYRYTEGERELESLVEGRSVDLIGVSWRPEGAEALIVGYDVIWHRAVLYRFDGFSVGALPYEEPAVYPTGVAWHPHGAFAFIGTASPYLQPEAGPGLVLRWEAPTLTPVFRAPDFRFGGLEWRPDGTEAFLMGGRNTRTYTA